VTQLLLRFRTGWNERSTVAEKRLIIDDDVAITEVDGLIADALGIGQRDSRRANTRRIKS
jgi:hypothetical protein